MSCQFLGRAQVHTPFAEGRQIRMPERVEIGMFGTVGSCDDVRHASGAQIDAKHHGSGAERRPGARPDGSAGWLVGEVGPHQFRDVGRQRLELPAPALVGFHGQRHRWHVASQVEAFGSQRAETTSAEAGAASERVQVEAIVAREAPKRTLALASGIEHATEFLGREFTASVAFVRVGVAGLQMCEGAGR